MKIKKSKTTILTLLSTMLLAACTPIEKKFEVKTAALEFAEGGTELVIQEQETEEAQFVEVLLNYTLEEKNETTKKAVAPEPRETEKVEWMFDHDVIHYVSQTYNTNISDKIKLQIIKPGETTFKGTFANGLETNELKIKVTPIEIIPVKEFIVKFMIDEEIFETQTIKEGKTAIFPFHSPTKEGFKFNYWATDKTFETKFEFATTHITEDTFIYAYFTEVVVGTEEVVAGEFDFSSRPFNEKTTQITNEKNLNVFTDNFNTTTDTTYSINIIGNVYDGKGRGGTVKDEQWKAFMQTYGTIKLAKGEGGAQIDFTFNKDIHKVIIKGTPWAQSQLELHRTLTVNNVTKLFTPVLENQTEAVVEQTLEFELAATSNKIELKTPEYDGVTKLKGFLIGSIEFYTLA